MCATVERLRKATMACLIWFSRRFLISLPFFFCSVGRATGAGKAGAEEGPFERDSQGLWQELVTVSQRPEVVADPERKQQLFSLLNEASGGQ